jgi:hypothetical protein
MEQPYLVLKFVHMIYKTREDQCKDKKRCQLDNQSAKEYLSAKTVLIGGIMEER